VAAAGVTANDVVLEVGPGTGNLTRFLVATGAQVRAALACGAHICARSAAAVRVACNAGACGQ
jgi:16S rRNA A1518/A1519 N6-dimethyltransferase RsmA/KsgA/DIM1 with predicted DNA glycosylase/AP lyase activity